MILRWKRPVRSAVPYRTHEHLTELECEMETLGFPAQITELRRVLDREVFFPAAEKHGIEISGFHESINSLDDMSDKLDSGLLHWAAGDYEGYEP